MSVHGNSNYRASPATTRSGASLSSKSRSDTRRTPDDASLSPPEEIVDRRSDNNHQQQLCDQASPSWAAQFLESPEHWSPNQWIRQRILRHGPSIWDYGVPGFVSNGPSPAKHNWWAGIEDSLSKHRTAGPVLLSPDGDHLHTYNDDDDDDDDRYELGDSSMLDGGDAHIGGFTWVMQTLSDAWERVKERDEAQKTTDISDSESDEAPPPRTDDQEPLWILKIHDVLFSGMFFTFYQSVYTRLGFKAMTDWYCDLVYPKWISLLSKRERKRLARSVLVARELEKRAKRKSRKKTVAEVEMMSGLHEEEWGNDARRVLEV